MVELSLVLRTNEFWFSAATENIHGRGWILSIQLPTVSLVV
jgi:hypothetical protein